MPTFSYSRTLRLSGGILWITALILSACSTQPAPTALPSALPQTSVPAAPATPTSLPTPTDLPTSTPLTTVVPATFSDPFGYCAAVKDADTPGPQYIGPKLPDPILKGLRTAAGLATDAPDEILQNGSSWRCLGGKVYACFVGANLPCDAKANTDRTPNQGEIDFCKATPNADNIPAVATGHETIYEWSCSQGTPQVGKQVFQVDPRGYIAEIWYPIPAQ
jgi:hypothetical protein